MYTPDAATQTLSICSFDAALAAEATSPCDYDRETWLYVPSTFAPYRYILGTRGRRPLICIGINPSTAIPGNLDPTLKSVQRIAAGNGFDSFIMFNVYAQRATNPDCMDRELNATLHRENMAAFRYILERCDGTPTVWAAWGTIIEKRDYLPACVLDMIAIGKEYGARWVTAGKCSKKGHPHHPLYLRADSGLDDFDPTAYAATANTW